MRRKRVRLRTVASGAVMASLTMVGLPVALSGAASATTTKSTAPTFTKCSPATVTLGKTVTIHGTNLGGATLTIDGTIVATTKTTAKVIKATVPLEGVAPKTDPIEIATVGGTVEGHCTFKAGKTPKP